VILDQLGVSAEELRQAVLNNHRHWLNLIAEIDAEAALQINDRLLSFCYSDSSGRSEAVGVLIKAASIYYKRKHFAKALVSFRTCSSSPAHRGNSPLGMALTRRITKAS
jgi:hypothetical protein